MKKRLLSISLLVALVFSACNNTKTKTNSSAENTESNTEITEFIPLPEETIVTNSEDDIQVYTVKIGNDPEKSHLTASFPITAYDFVNQNERAFTETLVNEFKQTFKEDQNQESVSSLDFNQHFEVKYHTEDFMIFLHERNVSYGNTYDDSFVASVFDLKNKKKLQPEDFFKSKESFEQFTQEIKNIARDLLKKRVQESPNYANDDERNEVIQSLEEALTEGTLPTEKNYDALFFDEKGDWYVLFDKYQIASGSMENFSVKIPQNIIEKYVADTFLKIFKKEEVTAQISDVNISEPVYSEVDCSKVPCVALTFDDGPSVYTSQLLDVLKEESVKATFFVLGKSASVQKQTLKRMAEEGHNIGNHSYDHKDFRKISDEEALRQIKLTDDIVAGITGEKPRYFRFPYGAHTKENLAMVGRPVIMWNVDPLDWKYREASRVAEAMSKTSPQGIILAHDIHKSTVQAIPQVIKNLKAQGYQIVSLDDLFRQKDLKNGQKYSSGK
ncbi:polysaccharide deacetylase family protein [Capnocytophaga stomatis]|uniref:polysaccharide deacetylase family protein n=1 Tax=Capnocytophaga stomatis TaxID=1848904 RepID=UPI001AC922A1|nr:polysaccharide deacetylase family protein [Capnocytophaga stomatis]GIM50242.1 peptidoglycan-N-acetylmuramic acid deacetylase PdaC [Capnocytophaga stomatis]